MVLLSKVAVTLDACSDVYLLRYPGWKEDVITLQKKRKKEKAHKIGVSGYSGYSMLLQRLNSSSIALLYNH